MSTIYYAEIEKLTEKELEILKTCGENDTLCLFYGKSATISIEKHEMLSSINIKKKYFQAETEAERCLSIGITIGSNMNSGEIVKNVLLTNITLSMAVKKQLNIVSSDKKQSNVTTKPTTKTKGRGRAKNNSIVETKTSVIEETKEDSSEDIETGKKERTKKTKEVTESSKKDTVETTKENIIEEVDTVEETEDDAVEEENIWTMADSELFFRNMCKLPDDYENRNGVLKDIAKIIFTSDDVNEALDKINAKYGIEVTRYLSKNINLLATSVKGGYNKRVDDVKEF